MDDSASSESDGFDIGSIRKNGNHDFTEFRGFGDGTGNHAAILRKQNARCVSNYVTSRSADLPIRRHM